MKNLLLMRHGKSSWELNVGDQDRALLQRGIMDAHLVGAKLAEENMAIDYVFSSPANRALHTAIICLRSLKYPLNRLKIVPDLYDFSGNGVLDFLKSLDDGLDTVLLFGHNHAFTHLVNSLGDRHIDNLPTSGFAHIQFNEGSWKDISRGSTIKTIFPKQLK
ncbi:histidine phosphatase family protein [Maribacter sp. MMG018]|uniref:SixA phosphatase family protein n=1 Tax=Maribacter sp. MMG018 TaxID=2822688 RepID=UPI001B36D91E|nr:histidine phosphatase family protein [Maribacter sp. MMG018]MBQ4914529.1 histidine phosphatase family protein [Maribacter sp. MMG018]